MRVSGETSSFQCQIKLQQSPNGRVFPTSGTIIGRTERRKHRGLSIQAEGARGSMTRKPPFFCVHAHRGEVLVFRDLARHLGMDQPFYGLQAKGVGVAA